MRAATLKLSTLSYAVLGLVARRRMTGYDIARIMRLPVGFFWQARHGQIYPELARLERLGLVSHTVVPQTQRPDKKLYAITATGRRELRRWLLEPVELVPRGDPLVLKAYSIWAVQPAKAATLFREQERRHAERLKEYKRRLKAQEAQWGSTAEDPSSPRFGDRVTLLRGIGFEREYRAWCRWVADRLDQRGAGQPTGRGKAQAARPAGRRT
jgi:PadR family transcriptional regulator AphA